MAPPEFVTDDKVAIFLPKPILASPRLSR